MIRYSQGDVDARGEDRGLSGDPLEREQQAKAHGAAIRPTLDRGADGGDVCWPKRGAGDLQWCGGCARCQHVGASCGRQI